MSEFKSTLLAREAVLAMPGFESRLYLVEFPPKIVGPLHANTEQCVGYVLQGRLEAAFGAGPVTVTRAGEAFVERPHEAHRFRNPDPKRVLRFVVTGTFRNEEPLWTPLSGGAGFDPHADSAAPDAMEPEASTRPLTEVKRTLLVRRELADFPGLESRLYLIEFPPAAKSKDHLHTAQGIGYVIDGSFESAFG
ncbi:MAG: cupin domain-containing protein, partial [Polyangiaceae bacterium]